jgi:2'-hydroxyisoflavone reductase
MRILIIGGTKFLGRHLVDAAVLRGHHVTLFNRGETAPELFPELEQIRGDRERDLALLEGRAWDAVIDTCGYEPEVVEQSVRALAGSAGQYVFISTASVYADPTPPGADETAPLEPLPPGERDDENRGAWYGPQKALCERVVLEGFPDRALIVRAGVLVGPHDPTDRLRYWIRRTRRGGSMLAPGSPDRALQLIDARDLAEWIVRCVEGGVSGIYNACGPHDRLTMGVLLDAIAAATSGSAKPVWVPEEFLLRQGVEPWSELPLWLPEADNGLMEIDLRRAFHAGLRIRLLYETLRDADDRGDEAPEPDILPSGSPASVTLTAQREAEILAAWQAAASAGSPERDV